MSFRASDRLATCPFSSWSTTKVGSCGRKDLEMLRHKRYSNVACDTNLECDPNSAPQSRLRVPKLPAGSKASTRSCLVAAVNRIHSSPPSWLSPAPNSKVMFRNAFRKAFRVPLFSASKKLSTASAEESASASGLLTAVTATFGTYMLADFLSNFLQHPTQKVGCTWRWRKDVMVFPVPSVLD